MAECPDDIKDRIYAEIVAHLRVYGRERWDLIREKPEYAPYIGKEAGAVGKRKFFRWVGHVTNGIPDPHVGVQGRHKETPDAAHDALDDGRRRALAAAQKNIPAAPSPAYMMRKGAEADNQINFLAVVHDLMRDANKMRAASVTPDEAAEDGEKIKNFHLFGQAFDKRLRLMETALKVMQEIWDLQYQQRFYDAIVAIIVEELAPYPEAQERAIRRLADLNSRRGMTLYADPL